MNGSVSPSINNSVHPVECTTRYVITHPLGALYILGRIMTARSVRYVHPMPLAADILSSRTLTFLSGRKYYFLHKLVNMVIYHMIILSKYLPLEGG